MKSLDALSDAENEVSTLETGITSVIPSPSSERMPRVSLSGEGRSSLSFSRSKPPLRSEGTVNAWLQDVH